MIDAMAVLLQRLKVPTVKYTYCHLSLHGCGLAVRDFRPLLDLLRAHLPGTTLVVPSFPFGGNAEYAAILDAKQVFYDVRWTACRVNLFGELFRRVAGVYRSFHPILPVAALGPAARDLVAAAHESPMPFGPSTAFETIVREKGCVLGLGVDVNTNSFGHFPDEPCVDRYPFPVYSDRPLHCHVLDGGRPLFSKDYHYFTLSLRRRIRPGRFHDLMKNQAFYRFAVGAVQAYVLELDPFVRYASKHAEEAVAAGRLPVWHAEPAPIEESANLEGRATVLNDQDASRER
jgi:aminoglycoside N3'-acetyltransferase